jgi:acetyl esterase/lipase
MLLKGGRSCIRAIAIAVAAVALAFPAGAGAAGRPVLLLFHPGGFIMGDPHQMDAAAGVASNQGFRPVEVDYPLWDMRAMLRTSLDLAAHWRNLGHPVYTYGESAGASLAAVVAERGKARRAAVQAPVADVPTWFAATSGWVLTNEQVAAALGVSPINYASKRPVHAYLPRLDALSPRSWAWVHADPLVTGQQIFGHHLEQPYRDNAMRSAIHYLADHAG